MPVSDEVCTFRSGCWLNSASGFWVPSESITHPIDTFKVWYLTIANATHNGMPFSIRRLKRYLKLSFIPAEGRSPREELSDSVHGSAPTASVGSWAGSGSVHKPRWVSLRIWLVCGPLLGAQDHTCVSRRALRCKFWRLALNTQWPHQGRPLSLSALYFPFCWRLCFQLRIFCWAGNSNLTNMRTPECWQVPHTHSRLVHCQNNSDASEAVLTD